MKFDKTPHRAAHDASGGNPPSGFWENYLAPFLDRYYLVLCLCLVGIASVRIITTYSALSLTADEPTHLACGLEYLAKHVYRFETQHPPLSRLMAAMGPYIIGVRPAGMLYSNDDGLTAIARSGQVDRVIFLMRLGILPFFLLACFVVGAWGKMFGRSVAVLAVGLYTLLPTALADAGLATNDMALGATVGAAFLTFIFWAKKPTVYRSLLLGLCTALACLSKFTALGYIPAAGILALTCYVTVRWPIWGGGKLPQSGFLTLAWNLMVRWSAWRDLWSLAKRRLVPFAIAVSFAGVLIWACYWFSVGSSTVHGYNVRLPAPEFFDGVRTAMRHSGYGQGSFLLGQFSWTGWWYYFPLVLLFKTPIAFLILFALGILVCIGKRARSIYLMPLAFSFGILFPAMYAHVDIGVRHIEPIYIGLSIISALGLRQLLRWARTGIASALTAGVLVAWMIVSVGAQNSDYLAYFNAFAGKTPENVLVDSNLDWGQDLKFLAKRLRELGVKEYSLSALLNIKYPQYYQAWYGLPPSTIVNPCMPSPGWNVIGATIEKSLSRWPGTPYYAGPGALKPWYEQIAPRERVGPLLLYYVPPDSQLNCLPSAGTSVTSATLPITLGYVPTHERDLGNAEVKITRLSNNFYTLEDQGGATGVLIGSDGLFVVDDEPAPLSPKILAAIKKLSNQPIQILFNTRAREEERVTFHVNGEDVELIPIPGAHIVYLHNTDIIMAGDFYGSMQYPHIDPANGDDLDGISNGFDTVLTLAGPHTKIVPDHGPPVGRTEVLAQGGMIADIRRRVAQLVAQGETQDQVLAAHPTADYDRLVPNSKESTQRFVVQVYADAIARGSAEWVR